MGLRWAYLHGESVSWSLLHRAERAGSRGVPLEKSRRVYLLEAWCEVIASCDCRMRRAQEDEVEISRVCEIDSKEDNQTQSGTLFVRRGRESCNKETRCKEAETDRHSRRP